MPGSPGRRWSNAGISWRPSWQGTRCSSLARILPAGQFTTAGRVPRRRPRLVGGWFVNLEALPKKAEVRLMAVPNGTQVFAHIEEDLGMGLLDPHFQARYEDYFRRWHQELLTAFPPVPGGVPMPSGMQPMPGGIPAPAGPAPHPPPALPGMPPVPGAARCRPQPHSHPRCLLPGRCQAHRQKCLQQM